MSNAETEIHNQILCELSRAYHPRGMFWRQNAGRVCTQSGAWVTLGPPGIADIVGSLDGRAVFVEVKRPGERQRKSQKNFQAAAERAGALYVVARSPEEAIEAVRPKARDKRSRS